MVHLAWIDFPLAHLHAVPLDEPHLMLEVDLRPRRLCPLACTNKHHHHQPKHDPGLHEHREFMLVESLQKFRQFVRCDCGMVALYSRLEGSAKARYRIDFSAA